MKRKILSKSENDTIKIAENLESVKFPNMVVVLNGELGSGKTVFSKAFAAALGIKEHVTSPTFNIVKEYLNGELPFFHMDVYRLKKGSDSGLEEYFDKNGVCLIEWGENIDDILPEERIDIEIKILDENRRVLYIEAFGSDYEDILEEAF